VPTSITVTVTPHWFNGWFLRLLAVPVVHVDGLAREVAWNRATQFVVDPGAHNVSAGARYRGSRAVLGAENVTHLVAEGQHVRLVAQNGPLNHQPFAVRPGQQLVSVAPTHNRRDATRP
jgi:hypothetical protein